MGNARFIRGVLVWLSGTLFVTYAFVVSTSFALYADNIVKSLHITSGQFNLASGVYTIVFGLMQIPAGYLIQNYNARIIVPSALIIFLVGLFLFSHTSSYPMLFVSDFVMALGAAFAFVATATLIGAWFSEKWFPIFLGLTQSISLISTSFLRQAFVHFLQIYSWQSIIKVANLIGLAVLGLVILFVSSPPKSQETPTGAGSEKLSFLASLKAVLSSPVAWIISIAAAFSFGSMLGYASFWSVISKQTGGLTPYEATIITGWSFWGIAIGTPFFGWVSNKLNQRLKLTVQMT